MADGLLDNSQTPPGARRFDWYDRPAIHPDERSPIPTPTAPTRSTQDIGHLARCLYPDGPLLTRFIQHHRHRICPIDRVAEQVPRNSAVLDIGCGGGLLVARLATTGRARTAHGIDASAPAITLAQGMAARLPDLLAEARPGEDQPEIRFEHRPVQQGLPEGQYDAVCLIDVMHHVPPSAQERAFRDAAGRVRPGGRFIYKDMCDAPLWRAGMNRLHDLVMARQWIRYVPIESVEAWAQGEGLVLAHKEDINMLWYGHELRVFEKPETNP